MDAVARYKEFEKETEDKKKEAKSLQKTRNQYEKAKEMEANRIASAKAKQAERLKQLERYRMRKLMEGVDNESRSPVKKAHPLADKFASPDVKDVAEIAARAKAAGAGDRHADDWIEAGKMRYSSDYKSYLAMGGSPASN